jgi:hypothetical protein
MWLIYMLYAVYTLKFMIPFPMDNLGDTLSSVKFLIFVNLPFFNLIFDYEITDF